MEDIFSKVWRQTVANEMINLDELRTGQHFILTQGLPASGKSMWAKVMLEWAEDQRIPLVRVNRDEIRLELGFKFDPKREDEVTQIQDARIMYALARGDSVICDDTYLNPQHVRQRKEMADSLFEHGKPEIQFHLVDWFIKNVSIEECIKRDLKREAYVGKDVIERLYYSWWERQEKPENKGSRRTILCDIDGTLALFKGNPFDRDFSLDTINHAVKQVLDRFCLGGYAIVLMSGRDSRHREATRKWLKVNNVWYDELHMRAPLDNRPDTVVKKELYMQRVQGKHRIEFVLDDRPSVVRMWRAECGLTVFQVAPNMEF